MRYMGGKDRLGKKIVEIMQPHIRERYIEPFVGSGAVLKHVMAPVRLARDSHPYLIALLDAVAGGKEFPSSVTVEQYKHVKEKPYLYEDSYVGFVGFCGSFGGKWFGGYARGEGRNFIDEGSRGLKKNYPYFKTAKFEVADYSALEVKEGDVIYCDPPYKGTTKYSQSSFDTEKFWNTVRQWANKGATVFVSEYQAPDDIELVAEFKHNQSLAKNANQNTKTVERLFRVCSQSEIAS